MADEQASNSDLVDDVMGTWDYSSLPANVRLGQDCFIETRLLLSPFQSKRDPGLVLGDRVRIYAGGWGGALNVEPTGWLEIGDDSVLVGAQVMCADHVTIGRRVVISYNAVIADSDFHPRDPDLRRADVISGAPYGDFVGYTPRYTEPVVIGDDVHIGINAIVLKGVTIGAGAHIGPGSVVTRDIPPGVTVQGNPATVVPPTTS